LRTGLIGVGPWGQKLADAFKACGHPITDYSRNPKSPDTLELGRRWNDWRHLVASVDVIVSAATPAVTYDVLGECLQRNKPALLTKPLYLNAMPEQTLVAPIMVDYVRLFSPYYRQIKRAASTRVIKSIDAVFCGDGPVRGFPGLYDYGPHVFAWIFDLAMHQRNFPYQQIELTRVEVMTGTSAAKKNYLITGKLGSISLNLRFGNGAILEAEKMKRLIVRFEKSPLVECYGMFEESQGILRANFMGLGKDEMRVEALKPAIGPDSPLTNMVQHFLDIAGHGGVVKPRLEAQTLLISMLAHNTLKQIAKAENDNDF
jgi:predicted dehydrogenase